MDWKLKDNKIVCYNYYNKIRRLSGEKVLREKGLSALINKEIKRIQKREKCDEYTASEIYKRELRAKLREVSNNEVHD